MNNAINQCLFKSAVKSRDGPPITTFWSLDAPKYLIILDGKQAGRYLVCVFNTVLKVTHLSLVYVLSVDGIIDWSNSYLTLIIIMLDLFQQFEGYQDHLNRSKLLPSNES